MDARNIKIEYKSTQLISILSQNFSGKMNLARIKFLGLFIVVSATLTSLFTYAKDAFW